jgi:hypothetical protein
MAACHLRHAFQVIHSKHGESTFPGHLLFNPRALLTFCPKLLRLRSKALKIINRSNGVVNEIF